MKVLSKPLGPVAANCYLICDDHHALIIDPGDVFTELDDLLSENECVLDAVLLTHAHFDHINGLDALLKKHDVPVYLNPKEFDFLSDPFKNASSSFFEHVTSNASPLALHEGKMQIGHFEVDCIFCPGHSIGSTVFLIGNCMFSGDVIFQSSIGRMDLPTGSSKMMYESLKKLSKLKFNYIICPGHGPYTSLDDEKKWNSSLKYAETL